MNKTRLLSSRISGSTKEQLELLSAVWQEPSISAVVVRCIDIVAREEIRTNEKLKKLLARMK